MTFRRTNSGLNNLYLFYGVDAVVYLEGGNSLTREDVDNGLYSNSTADIRYWQALFSFYRPGKRFQFCSIGSKQTVKSIADDVIRQNIKNIIVAMDRDFDNINATLTFNQNVIFTRGYSWENDAWRPEAVLEAYCIMSGSCKTEIQGETKTLLNYFDKCAYNLRGAVRADAVLSQNGSSLFCRDSYMRYIHISPVGYPDVNVGEIRKSLATARRREGKGVFSKTHFHTSPFIDCFGHLFAEYGYRILKYLLERVKKLPKIPKDYANALVVEKFVQLIANRLLPELKDHYDMEFARVVP